MRFCLSKPTLARLSTIAESSSIPATIQYAGLAVGISLEPLFPISFVLPAGLDIVRSDAHTLAQDLLRVEEECLPSMVTLRYAACLTTSLESIGSTVDELRCAELVTVNGQLFSKGHVLCDMISDKDSSQAVAIRAYSPFSSRRTGLVFSRADADSVVSVPVDALMYCAGNLTRSELMDIFANTVDRLLRAALTVSEDGAVRFSHHGVLGGGLCITQIVPTAQGELSDEATTRRGSMHDLLCIPTNKPLFRRAYRKYSKTVFSFTDGGWPGRLSGVHYGIKSHGLGEGGVTVHLVQGNYLYCHYLQDKFNDSGWGCAYRSLQTLFSWVAMEKYCTFDEGRLPSHKVIQKALADIGDKPSSFVGSKEWIGANEVCYALEKLTGIGSKILHVSRGAEMEGKGRELARHFDEQGSPVMVGGGVLAWTILGVARNSRTGQTRFLILDPHYEGRDDLTTIHNKGWVGWKSAEIFVPNAFYNLCMPLRPFGV